MCEKFLKLSASGFIVILCMHHCKTPEKALHKAACAGGDIDACFQLGKLQYEAGENITVRKKLIDSCNSGNLEGCMSLGALALGQGNRTEAKRFLRKACSGNIFVACYGLAEIEYDAGNTATAKKLFLKACDGGYLEGCWDAPLKTPVHKEAILE